MIYNNVESYIEHVEKKSMIICDFICPFCETLPPFLDILLCDFNIVQRYSLTPVVISPQIGKRNMSLTLYI